MQKSTNILKKTDAEKSINIDSGILTFVNKGSYYEDKNIQLKKIMDMWRFLFNKDRYLFSLLMILNGTYYAKASMSHFLLGNKPTNYDTSFKNFIEEFEKKIILFNLRRIEKEGFSNALRFLKFFSSGFENRKKINNSRTRKIILEFLYFRDIKNLDWSVINFKKKYRDLTTHALGKQDTTKILNGDIALFNKKIGRYQKQAYPVFLFIFGKNPFPTEIYNKINIKSLKETLPNINNYIMCKETAINGDKENFIKYSKKLPYLTVVGLRNNFKLNVDLKDIHQKTVKSKKQIIQTKSAEEKSGYTERVINYENYDLYELFKLVYYRIGNDQNPDPEDKIFKAMAHIDSKIKIFDLGGPIHFIIDSSDSSKGSDKRYLHPFLTSCCIPSLFFHVIDADFSGGKLVSNNNLLYPSGGTDLGGKFHHIINDYILNKKEFPKFFIIISDGYENGILKIQDVYDALPDNIKEKFEIIHFNPVMSAFTEDDKTTKTLLKNSPPIPVTDYRYVENEFIFRRIIENTDMVKEMLITKAKTLKLLEG